MTINPVRAASVAPTITFETGSGTGGGNATTPFSSLRAGWRTYRMIEAPPLLRFKTDENIRVNNHRCHDSYLQRLAMTLFVSASSEITPHAKYAVGVNVDGLFILRVLCVRASDVAGHFAVEDDR